MDKSFWLAVFIFSIGTLLIIVATGGFLMHIPSFEEKLNNLTVALDSYKNVLNNNEHRIMLGRIYASNADILISMNASQRKIDQTIYMAKSYYLQAIDMSYYIVNNHHPSKEMFESWNNTDMKSIVELNNKYIGDVIAAQNKVWKEKWDTKRERDFYYTLYSFFNVFGLLLSMMGTVMFEFVSSRKRLRGIDFMNKGTSGSWWQLSLIAIFIIFVISMLMAWSSAANGSQTFTVLFTTLAGATVTGIIVLYADKSIQDFRWKREQKLDENKSIYIPLHKEIVNIRNRLESYETSIDINNIWTSVKEDYKKEQFKIRDLKLFAELEQFYTNISEHEKYMKASVELMRKLVISYLIKHWEDIKRGESEPAGMENKADELFKVLSFNSFMKHDSIKDASKSLLSDENTIEKTLNTNLGHTGIDTEKLLKSGFYDTIRNHEELKTVRKGNDGLIDETKILEGKLNSLILEPNF